MNHRQQGVDILQKGIRLTEQDRFDESIVEFEKITDTVDDVCNALIQRGRAHWEMKRWGESIRDFELAHRMAPDNADLKWTLCLIYLQLNQFEKGWKNFEDRWESKKFDSPRLKTRVPKWTRTSTAKDILVWSEQGVGDQILYSSLLPEVRQYVTDLTVMVDARLIPLYKRSMPSISFVPQNTRVSEIDAQIALGSLGAEFIKAMDDIPQVAARNYLKPDPDRLKSVWNSLNKQKGEIIIGLSWRSGAPRIGNHKSIPIEDIISTFGNLGVRFVSLQYNLTHEEKEAFGDFPIEFLDIDMTHDFDGQAAVIKCCDYVISCSNATAHLAGAVGAKVFLLDANKLWFWNNRRGRQNLWYPNTMVYPRDNVIAPWQLQLDQVKKDLVTEINDIEFPVVLFHVGDDVTQPARLIASIRRYMPTAKVIVCSDNKTPDMDCDIRFDHYVDRNHIMTERLRAFAELNLNEPALYVDSDMAFLQSVYPEDVLGDDEVVICRRSFNRDATFNVEQRGLEFPEYQGMTLDEVYPYLACFTVTRSNQYWKELISIAESLDTKFHVWYGDQEAIRMYAERYPVKAVEERHYACLPEQASQVNRPKILHYKGGRK